MKILDLLFCQITTFIKVCLAIVFGLHFTNDLALSVLYNFSIHYFPGKKTGWASVFWNWLRFAFILIFLWMRNTQKYPFSVLFNSIFFLYKTWMSVRISKLIEVCFQKFNLIFFVRVKYKKIHSMNFAAHKSVF